MGYQRAFDATAEKYSPHQQEHDATAHDLQSQSACALECLHYNLRMGWDIEGTDQFKEWFLGLTDAEDKAVSASIETLERFGPALGRPLVDTIDDSRIANLKELRPKRNNIRILFVFDPRRDPSHRRQQDERLAWLVPAEHPGSRAAV
jgi:hypothetical protein